MGAQSKGGRRDEQSGGSSLSVPVASRETALRKPPPTRIRATKDTSTCSSTTAPWSRALRAPSLGPRHKTARTVAIDEGETLDARTTFLLRDSSHDGASTRLPANSSPRLPALVYTASKFCDVSDRGSSVRRTHSNSQSFESNTPHAPSEVARVGLTAPAACTPSGGCDDERPQAHGRGRL
jgi:hypothetical protein